jgi:hypothetical protein
LAPTGEANEGFRSGAVAIPVLLVGRPDASEVEGKRRVPIAEAARFRDAGILGGQVGVGGVSGQRDDALHAELRRPGVQARVGAPHVVFQRGRVAHSRAQFAGSPVVQRDAILAGGGQAGVERGHYRIGNLAAADADAVHQVGQKRLGAQTERIGGGEGRRGHRVADQRAVAFERQASGLFEGARAEANVGQGVALLEAERQRGLACSTAHQERVDFSRLIQVALKAGERHVGGADFALLLA